MVGRGLFVVSNAVPTPRHTAPMVDSWQDLAARHQRILNSHPIPARRLQRTLYPEPAIAARIVWARDGEETIETVAIGYTAHLAHVRIHDPRWLTIAVWLAPEDVRRV